MPRNVFGRPPIVPGPAPLVSEWFYRESSKMSVLLILMSLGELGDVDVLEHGPDESDELAGDSGARDLLGLLGGEPVEDLVEPMLTLPRL